MVLSLSEASVDRLYAAGRQPPAQPRIALGVGGSRVGSVAEPLLARLGLAGPWEGLAHTPLSLDGLAQALKSSGLVPTWREERLAVSDEQGRAVASVERGAARWLGITVQSVHLVGVVPGVGIWVQQRAWDKAEDPGRWDTLMGGTVAWGESVHATLRRETAEEAGLDLDGLLGLVDHGVIDVARPGNDANQWTYHADRIHCFGAQVPVGSQPMNTDGEVAQFALLPTADLERWIEEDRFTVDAANVLWHVLGARAVQSRASRSSAARRVSSFLAKQKRTTF